MNHATRYFGIHLDPASTARAVVSAPDCQPAALPSCEIPPAAIWDSAGHLHLMPDGVHPLAEIRGTGIGRDSSSSTLAELQQQRITLAEAWRRLLFDSEPDNGNRPKLLERIPPSMAAEAIAIVAGAALDTPESLESTTVASLVIPNSLDESSQQLLINSADSLGTRDGRLRLIWRPIAAALSWCVEHEQLFELKPSTQEKSIGSLLCLHLGINEFEVTRLRIIPRAFNGRTLLLPARDRPAGGILAEGDAGRQFLEDLADMSLPDSCRLSPEQQWRMMWASSWLRGVLSGNGNTVATLTPRQRIILKLAAGVEPNLNLGEIAKKVELARFGVEHRIAAWTAATTLALAKDKEPWIGAIVTGPFAAVPWRESTFGESLIYRLTRTQVPNCTVISTFGDSVDPVAAGAAIFSARADQGWPTYLDTLPNLQLLTIQKGEPVWLDVLKNSQTGEEAPRYVDGDREWRRQPDLVGVSLAKGSRLYKFSLMMEPHPTVKEVVAQLPESPKEKVRVRLEVRMTPAKGFAKIRVVSEEATYALERPVLLDFATMKDTHKSPDEIRDSLPRGFPDLAIRSASPTRWRAAEDDLRKFTNDFAGTTRIGADRLMRQLVSLRDTIRQKDPPMVLFAGGTAISSDGTPPPSALNTKRLMIELTEALVSLLSHKSEAIREEALAVLAYASCQDSRLAKHLRELIADRDYQLHHTTVIAIGNCLSAPSDVALALSRLTHDLKQGMPPRDRVNAIAQLCRYREHALSEFPSKKAEVLLEALRELIEGEYDEKTKYWKQYKRTRRLAFIFRESCRSVLFLLRRRRYDEDFLPPTRVLAENLKNVFSRVEAGIKGGRLEFMAGAVNQADTFAQINLYIDWKGSGVVNFGED